MSKIYDQIRKVIGQDAPELLLYEIQRLMVETYDAGFNNGADSMRVNGPEYSSILTDATVELVVGNVLATLEFERTLEECRECGERFPEELGVYNQDGKNAFCSDKCYAKNASSAIGDSIDRAYDSERDRRLSE